MTTDEITTLVTAPGDLMQVLQDADPADKGEVYSRLGLTLAYTPRTETPRAATGHPGRPWSRPATRAARRPQPRPRTRNYRTSLEREPPIKAQTRKARGIGSPGGVAFGA
jgi:hypothetical protein